jgi:CHAD domain-containing protein
VKSEKGQVKSWKTDRFEFQFALFLLHFALILMADGKWIAGLTPEMPVADAARVVLAERFGVVRRYLPLAAEKPYEDAEYVHQLRVATRRSGAALRVFADCFPRKPHKAVRRQLRSIRRAAGDARDWDVFRLGLPGMKTLGGSGKPALDFLTGYAMGERSAAQTRLADAAADDGPGFLEASTEFPVLAHAPRGDSPPSTFGVFAAIRFGELLRAFDEAVRANPTEPAALHQLRILGKRARYALEIFADCFPPGFKDAVYPAVEKAQELLGEIQDAVVARDRLTALRARLKLTAPDEWSRLQKGLDGLIQAMRAKIPAGRKAFQAWRKEWTGLIDGVKVEVVAATVTA